MLRSDELLEKKAAKDPSADKKRDTKRLDVSEPFVSKELKSKSLIVFNCLRKIAAAAALATTWKAINPGAD